MHGPNLILFFVQIAHADSQLQHAMVSPTAEAEKRPQNAPLRNRQNFFPPPSCTQNDSFPSFLLGIQPCGRPIWPDRRISALHFSCSLLFWQMPPPLSFPHFRYFPSTIHVIFLSSSLFPLRLVQGRLLQGGLAQRGAGAQRAHTIRTSKYRKNMFVAGNFLVSFY